MIFKGIPYFQNIIKYKGAYFQKHTIYTNNYIAFYDQLTEGLKSYLIQNKQIYHAIYNIKKE